MIPRKYKNSQLFPYTRQLLIQEKWIENGPICHSFSSTTTGSANSCLNRLMSPPPPPLHDKLFSHAIQETTIGWKEANSTFDGPSSPLFSVVWKTNTALQIPEALSMLWRLRKVVSSSGMRTLEAGSSWFGAQVSRPSPRFLAARTNRSERLWRKTLWID